MKADGYMIDGQAAAQAPIFYFDFLPVLERSRTLSRNPERIQLMCEHCVKRLAPADLIASQPTGFFLIVQSCAGTAAEALAHEINVALLELFFGTDAFVGLGTICRRATLSELDAVGMADAVSATRAPSLTKESDAVEPDPLARLSQGGVPGYDGLETGFLPIFNLRNSVASIFLCGAIRRHENGIAFGTEALKETDAKDRASLDEAILEYSVGYARRILPTKHAAVIGATVSYETLAWSRGRQLYQKALRAAAMADNPFFLVKIEDVPRGTPPARLAEVVATVRPFARRVFLEIPEWDTALLRSGNLGAAGFVVSLPPDSELPMVGRRLADVSKFAATQLALTCVTNVGRTNEMTLARAAGFRFAASRVRGERHLSHPPQSQVPIGLAA